MRRKVLEDFIQPTLAVALLNMEDFDGFVDRHLAAICPERMKTYIEDLVSPPENTISFGNWLTDIKLAHLNGIEYEVSENAKKVFQELFR